MEMLSWHLLMALFTLPSAGAVHRNVSRRQPRPTGSPLADSTSIFTTDHATLLDTLPDQAHLQALQQHDVMHIADELFADLLQTAVQDMTAPGTSPSHAVLWLST